jgi:hypothetical protein
MATPDPDPQDIRRSATITLAAHVPDSETGCCVVCGRSTLPGGCDAQEVQAARLILQGGRPEYRVPGANHRGLSYA